jgi:hypothetical protein
MQPCKRMREQLSATGNEEIKYVVEEGHATCARECRGRMWRGGYIYTSKSLNGNG